LPQFFRGGVKWRGKEHLRKLPVEEHVFAFTKALSFGNFFVTRVYIQTYRK